VTEERTEVRTLGALLSEQRVILPLHAATLPDALRLLAAGAVADGLADRDQLEPELETLTEQDLIPIGSHALMAHLRTEHASELTAMMGVADGPLPFAPPTAPAARTLILVIAPPATGQRYLPTMAALARLLGRGDVEEILAASKSAADVLGMEALQEPILGIEILVRDLMTRDIVSVTPEAPMAYVAELLIRRRLRAIPVAGPTAEVVGMVTDADVMEMFLPRIRGEERASAPESGGPPDRPVREVMQRSFFTARDDETIEAVVDRMIRKDIERMPVVTEGRLVGFLTRGDIIRRLLRGHLRARGEQLGPSWKADP
jgi:CBS domain-containing protein